MRKIYKKIAYFLLLLFFLLGIFQPLYSLSKILLHGRLLDFADYYLPAAKASLHGISIYDAGSLGFVLNYPPTVLFFLLPWSVFDQFWGQIVWTGLSLFALFASFFLIIKSIALKLKKEEYLLFIPLILLAFPTKFNFGMGQINNFILLMIVLAYHFDRKTQKGVSLQGYSFLGFLSGAILGLATAIKLFPGILIFYFLAKGKWKAFGSTVITTITLFVLNGLIFGFDQIIFYFTKRVPALLNITGLELYFNQAFSGLVLRIFKDQDVAILLIRVFGLIVLFVSLRVIFSHKTKSSTTNNPLVYSLLISTALLVNNFSWQHHFVLLLFPFLVVYKEYKKTKNKGVLVLLIMCYTLVAYNLKQRYLLTGYFFTPLIFSHVLVGNIVLWTYLLFANKKKA